MLRSQDGVESVEDPYGNLKQGLIKITAKKDKALDLAKIVQVLEKEIGFEPVTEVNLELRGRLARRNGKLFFEADGSGQAFQVQKVAGGEKPSENQLLEAVAMLAQPHSADRIILKQWKTAGASADRSAAPPAAPAAAATVELAISGMT